MRPTVALVVLALAPASAAAEVSVRVTGGRVDLVATAAPVGDVLDRLARQTGMKVVYEGPAPRQLVTLSIQGRTPAEAVLAVLEGLGVNYALVGDLTGAGVQTLMVAGAPAASASAGTAATSRPAPGMRRPFGPVPPPGSSPDSPDQAFEEEDVPEDAGLPAGVPPAADGSDPAAGVIQAPAALPQNAPGPPVGGSPYPVREGAPGFSASPFTPQPQPLQPAVRAPTPSPTPAAPPAPGPEENPASVVPPPP